MDVSGNAMVVGGGERSSSADFVHRRACSLTRNAFQGSGIGKACAIGFAKDGTAGILIADVNLDAARIVAVECMAASTATNFRAEALHIDITKEESVETAMKHMVETFGRIDYCVNCAGVSILA